MPDRQDELTMSVGSPARSTQPGAPTHIDADTPISISLVIAICGGVAVIGGAASVIYKLVTWIQSHGARRAQQEAELEHLRQRIEGIAKNPEASGRYTRTPSDAYTRVPSNTYIRTPSDAFHDLTTSSTSVPYAGTPGRQEDLGKILLRIDAVEELMRGLHKEVDGVINKIMDVSRDTSVLFAKASQDASQREVGVREYVHNAVRDTRQELEKRVDSSQRVLTDKLNEARERLSTDCARLDAAQKSLSTRIAELDKQYMELYGKYRGLKAAINSLPTHAPTATQQPTNNRLRDDDSGGDSRV